MDTQLELIDHLRKKIKEVGKKSAARKTALKQLEKAYIISQQALELSVRRYSNLKDSYDFLTESNKQALARNAELEKKSSAWNFLDEIL